MLPLRAEHQLDARRRASRPTGSEPDCRKGPANRRPADARGVSVEAPNDDEAGLERIEAQLDFRDLPAARGNVLVGQRADCRPLTAVPSAGRAVARAELDAQRIGAARRRWRRSRGPPLPSGGGGSRRLAGRGVAASRRGDDTEVGQEAPRPVGRTRPRCPRRGRRCPRRRSSAPLRGRASRDPRAARAPSARARRAPPGPKARAPLRGPAPRRRRAPPAPAGSASRDERSRRHEPHRGGRRRRRRRRYPRGAVRPPRARASRARGRGRGRSRSPRSAGRTGLGAELALELDVDVQAARALTPRRRRPAAGRPATGLTETPSRRSALRALYVAREVRIVPPPRVRVVDLGGGVEGPARLPRLRRRVRVPVVDDVVQAVEEGGVGGRLHLLERRREERRAQPRVGLGRRRGDCRRDAPPRRRAAGGGGSPDSGRRGRCSPPPGRARGRRPA